VALKWKQDTDVTLEKTLKKLGHKSIKLKTIACEPLIYSNPSNGKNVTNTDNVYTCENE